jgi:hypothetical protein
VEGSCGDGGLFYGADENHENPLVRIACHRAETRTRDFSNTKQACQPLLVTFCLICMYQV